MASNRMAYKNKPSTTLEAITLKKFIQWVHFLTSARLLVMYR